MRLGAFFARVEPAALPARCESKRFRPAFVCGRGCRCPVELGSCCRDRQGFKEWVFWYLWFSAVGHVRLLANVAQQHFEHVSHSAPFAVPSRLRTTYVLGHKAVAWMGWFPLAMALAFGLGRYSARIQGNGHSKYSKSTFDSIYSDVIRVRSNA